MTSKAGVSRPSPDWDSSQVPRSQYAEWHLDASESEEIKRAVQTGTLRQTETPMQLQDRTKDEVTEEGCVETLLVHTETPTQLLPNPVNQEIQLIDGDTGGFTEAVHSHGECCGDTEVLPNDVDSHYSGSGCDEGMGSGFASRDRNLLDGNKQFLMRISSVLVSEPGSGIPGQFSSYPEEYQRNEFPRGVAECDVSPVHVSKKLNPGELTASQYCRELFDSDATTEEGEVEDLGRLEAFAESTPHDDRRHVEGFSDCRPWSGKVVNSNAGKVVKPLLLLNEKMFGEQHLIGSERSPDSKRRSGRPQQEILSVAGVEESPSKKAFTFVEPELHGTAAECNAGQSILPSMQTPKAASAITQHSPRVSTSRSRSRSIAFVRAASLRASGLSAAARNTLIGHVGNDSVDKDNSDANRTLKELKGGEDVGALSINEPRTEGHAARGEKCELKGHSRPSGQNVRKLFCGVQERSEEIIPSEPEKLSAVNEKEGRDSAIVNALQIAKRGICDAAEKTIKGAHTLEEERSRNLSQQVSLPSGFMSASTNLSYLESQEPGEESQLNALDVVDKVVWLNTTGVSHNIGPNMVPEQPCVKGSQTAQGIQCLAHAAQIKNMQDKMGVYDWVDSQQDDAELSSDVKDISGPCKVPKKLGVYDWVDSDEAELSSDIKEVSGPCKVPKRLVRAPKLIRNKKRLRGFEQQRVKSAFQAGDRSDDNVSKGKGTSSLIGWAAASNMKSPMDSKHVVNRTLKPQTLPTARVRNVNKVGSKQPQHVRNVCSLEDLPTKYGEQKKTIKESSKFIEREVSNCMHNLHVDSSKKRKLQDVSENGHKGKSQSFGASVIGSDSQIAIEAMDISRHGPVGGEVLTQRKRKKRNQVETLEAGEWSAFDDDTRQQAKRHQRSSEMRDSTIITRLKGRKRVSLPGIFKEHGQCNTENQRKKLKDEFAKRGLQPKSQAQGPRNTWVGSSTEELGSEKNATKINDSTQGNSKRRMKSQNEKPHKRSVSLKHPMVAESDVLDLDKQSQRKGELDKGKRPLTRQQSTINMVQQDVVNEVNKGLKANINSSGELLSINGKKESWPGVPLNSQKSKKNNNRKNEGVDESVFDFVKTHITQIQNVLPKFKRHGLNFHKRLHGLRNTWADRSTEELGSLKNVINNDSTRCNSKRRLKSQREKPDKASLFSKQVMVPETVILDLDKQSVRKEEGSNMRKRPMTRQWSTIKMAQQDVVNEAGGGLMSNVNSSAALLSVSGMEELCLAEPMNSLKCKKNHERNSGAADESVFDQKHLPKLNRHKFNIPKRLMHDGSSSPISRRTRSSLCASGSRERYMVDDEGWDLNCEPHDRLNIPKRSSHDGSSSPISRRTSSLCASGSRERQTVDDGGRDLDCELHDRLNVPKRPSHDGSSSPISRRTRSFLCASSSRERHTVDDEGRDLNCEPCDRRVDRVGSYADGSTSLIQVNRFILRNRVSRHRNGGDRDRQFEVPAVQTAKTSKGKTIKQKKKTTSSENQIHLGFSPILDEGRRRKREPGCVHVLFSHSLHEDTTKHQKKILAKLGGHIASSPGDCTHFVADCFVRTRNMLESIAAGKAIITSLWLESCGQACYFVDEKNYILQDAKKEKELGFSMHLSLAAAQRKPILQGMKVLVSPNTTPNFEAVKAIIESAGGQAVQEVSNFSKMDATRNGTVLFVVACEKDYEFCLPLLGRGFKVYSTEFILNGIIRQHLDFSRNQLFEEYIRLNRPSRLPIKF